MCFLIRTVGYVVGTFLCQVIELHPVGILNIESARFKIGIKGDKHIIDYVPKHNAYQQQFYEQPGVRAPFVYYLFQQFLIHRLCSV